MATCMPHAENMGKEEAEYVGFGSWHISNDMLPESSYTKDVATELWRQEVKR